jgi:ribonuclease P protein subunit POP4
MPKFPDITRDELIGRPIKVTAAKNKANLGISGKVVDETKYQVIIDTPKGYKKFPKKGSIFQIQYSERKVNIAGELLIGAPEERIKGAK